MKCAIKFSWSGVKNSYISKIRLEGYSTVDQVLKLDTGAANTILSLLDLNSLFGFIKYKVEDLESIFSLYKVPCKGFSTVSGGILYGYPCKLTNVVINNTIIPEFYFFLCLDDLNEISLLGADFIRSCSLAKNVDGAIYIEEINFKRYNANFRIAIKNTTLVALNKLEDYKDYAASFREVYKEV